MKKILLLIFVLVPLITFCQQNEQYANVQGLVQDARTHQPLPYATVTFYNLKTDGFTGMVTDDKGVFSIDVPHGNYKISIQFLSFKAFIINNLNIDYDIDLGLIEIEEAIEELKEVEVKGTSDLIDYQFDKKIYNASRDIANLGGTAITVLENTPTVRVDEQGKIVIRGNEAMILVNGKPFAAQANYQDLLQSIPSNSISQVEIISRSAKYDAQGGGGIINIILKKNSEEGYNGTIEIHGGIPDDDGLSTFLNYNAEKVSIYSTASFNHLNQIKYSEIQQFYTDPMDQPAGNLYETRDDDRQRNSFLFNIGSDFRLDEKNTISSSLLYSMSNKNYDSDLVLTDFDPVGNIKNLNNRMVEDNTDENYFEFLLNYTLNFNKENHKISFDARYDQSVSDNITDITNQNTMPSSFEDEQKTIKDQSFSTYMFQMDYSLPLGETVLMETGFKSNLRDYENDFNLFGFDSATRLFLPIEGFENMITYTENVYAAYLNLSKSYEKLNLSLGLRMEHSDVKITDLTNENKNHYEYTDLFPNFNLGYTFNDESLFSLNYTRLIERPDISQLNPYVSFVDERFIVQGNPYLQPYYSHYLVMEYYKKFEKFSLNSAFFASMDQDQFLTVLENTGNKTEEGFDIFTRKPINNGDLNQFGLEFDLMYFPMENLRFRALVSPYYFELTETLNESYDYSDYVLYGNFIADYRLKQTWKFQVNFTYQSPKKTALTKLDQIMYVNAVVSNDILDNKATLSLSARDIFKSREIIYESMEAGVQTDRYSIFEPQFVLSFSYRFNRAPRQNAKNRSKDINMNIFEIDEDEKN